MYGFIITFFALFSQTLSLQFGSLHVSNCGIPANITNKLIPVVVTNKGQHQFSLVIKNVSSHNV